MKVLKKKNYYIKDGYNHRNEYQYFDDTSYKDEHQKEVYMKALNLIQSNNLKSVIDVGCGSGFKLINYLGDYRTTGIDVTETVNFLIKQYPTRKWFDTKTVDFAFLKADIVICSDVIEHVLNPDFLLNNIKQIQNVKYIIISTPDRDLARGINDMGPPGNKTHIREWNMNEFQKFISSHFKIKDHVITNREQYTQMVVCEPKTNYVKKVKKLFFK